MLINNLSAYCKILVRPAHCCPRSLRHRQRSLSRPLLVSSYYSAAALSLLTLTASPSTSFHVSLTPWHNRAIVARALSRSRVWRAWLGLSLSNATARARIQSASRAPAEPRTVRRRMERTLAIGITNMLRQPASGTIKWQWCHQRTILDYE
jgi:hypothetical protein